MIVTIDGPAGSGKSTVARLLAERLRVRFLDTGAMYRAVALAVRQAQLSETDAESIRRLVPGIHLEFRGQQLLLNGTDVSDAIRSPEVTAISSIVASHPDVRARLVELQREIGRQGSLVTEGRDQGTIVFPQAEHKFFLTASIDARASRRQQELTARGAATPLDDVREQLRERDERDETRALAPMKPAHDATILDTSDLTIPQVLETLVRRITETHSE